jgi:hypothetical protein
VANAHERVQAAKAELRVAESELQACVREALTAGAKATDLANLLVVSRARLYQIRDGSR